MADDEITLDEALRAVIDGLPVDPTKVRYPSTPGWQPETMVGKAPDSPLLFRCAEDATELAGLYLQSDQMRGPCPLCNESDQRCQCWEDDA